MSKANVKNEHRTVIEVDALTAAAIMRRHILSIRDLGVRLNGSTIVEKQNNGFNRLAVPAQSFYQELDAPTMNDVDLHVVEFEEGTEGLKEVVDMASEEVAGQEFEATATAEDIESSRSEEVLVRIIRDD
jgi:hypothetical protein